jgi:hypothetical protein
MWWGHIDIGTAIIYTILGIILVGLNAYDMKENGKTTRRQGIMLIGWFFVISPLAIYVATRIG